MENNFFYKKWHQVDHPDDRKFAPKMKVWTTICFQNEKKKNLQQRCCAQRLMIPLLGSDLGMEGSKGYAFWSVCKERELVSHVDMLIIICKQAKWKVFNKIRMLVLVFKHWCPQHTFLITQTRQSEDLFSCNVSYVFILMAYFFASCTSSIVDSSATDWGEGCSAAPPYTNPLPPP